MGKLFVAFVLSALAHGATAATVTYTITGTVTLVNNTGLLPFTVTAGDPMSLSLRLSDSAGSDVLPADPTTGFYLGGVEAMTFTIGANVVPIPFVNLAGAQSISIRNNFLQGTGQFEDGYFAVMQGFPNPPAAPSVGFAGALNMFTRAQPAPTVLNSESYGLIPSNWAQFATKELLLDVHQQGRANSRVTGTFNTISAVPLPAAGWLLVTGVLGLCGVSRRKQEIAAV